MESDMLPSKTEPESLCILGYFNQETMTKLNGLRIPVNSCVCVEVMGKFFLKDTTSLDGQNTPYGILCNDKHTEYVKLFIVQLASGID